MEFTYQLTWIDLDHDKNQPKPFPLEDMKRMYEQFFLDIILKLEVDNTIESDFRLIKRVK